MEDISAEIEEWLVENPAMDLESDICAIRNRGKRIGLFGLSGNPPHNAHVEIVRYMKSLPDTFDSIIILPVYQHMFQSKRDTLGDTTFEDRLAMCKLAFCEPFHADEGKEMPNSSVFVLPLERHAYACAAAINAESAESAKSAKSEFSSKQRDRDKSKLQCGTAFMINFLEILLEPHIAMATPKPSSFHFGLCLGLDTASDLCAGKWRNSKEIVQKCDLHVIFRGERETEMTEMEKKTYENTARASLLDKIDTLFSYDQTSVHKKEDAVPAFTATNIRFHAIHQELSMLSSTLLRETIAKAFELEMLITHEYMSAEGDISSDDRYQVTKNVLIDDSTDQTCANIRESTNLQNIQECEDVILNHLPAAVGAYIRDKGLFIAATDFCV